MSRRRESDAEAYLKAVSVGEVVACGKLKRLAELMLPRFREPYKRWHFDIDAAERPVRFIEQFCKLPSGRLGEPFLLEPFEKAWIELIFGFVDDDRLRQFQEAFIEVARKNGKSALGSAIELYMLMADMEGAPQIYNCATSKDQASLAYGNVLKMMRQSKQLSARLRKGTVPERDQDGVMFDGNMGYITPLTSQTRHLDGLDVHMCLFDELHACTNRDMYDLLKQGMAARSQPLMLCISTNGFERDNIFDDQYDYAEKLLDGKVTDDRFLPIIYELDSRDEWEDESAWVKANPGLGTVKRLEFLRDCVNKARQDPSFLGTVLTKDFNVPESRAAAWLSFEEAVNEETFDASQMGFEYGIAGFDASDSIDLTAARMMLMRPGDDRIYELSAYWIPEDALRVGSGRRSERDDVPYRKWVERGLLRVVPGNKIDKAVFLDWLEEVKAEYDVYTFAVGFDPWHMDDTTRRNLEAYVGKSRTFDVRQGVKTLSQPMKQIRVDLAANRIVDNHNPINEWCRMNVSAKRDVNDNIQPEKVGRQAKNRIDGFAAELDAYVVLNNLMEDYQAVI